MKEDSCLQGAFLDEAWQQLLGGSDEQASGEETIISNISIVAPKRPQQGGRNIEDCLDFLLPVDLLPGVNCQLKVKTYYYCCSRLLLVLLSSYCA